MIRSVPAFVALVLLSGCQSLADGAKEQFSRDNTCPLDRVVSFEPPHDAFVPARASASVERTAAALDVAFGNADET
ncbi:MAG: hypothetical protein ACREJX_08590 [Polyangiaceae bacterium]